MAWVKAGALICGALLWSAISARAEYLVDVRDTLEISVAGVPELRQRVVVQLDGSISYPLLGTTFIVAGLPPSALRAKVRETLPSKVFRQRTPDGRGNVVVIDPDHIAFNVVEYRPIYVDVAKEQAHIWRLKIELGGEDKAEQSILQGTPLPSSMVSQMTRLEAEQLKAHKAEYERQKEFLRHGIKQTDEQIGVLSDQLQKESAGLQADTEDLQRAGLLFGKGAVPINRITDARRALLLS